MSIAVWMFLVVIGLTLFITYLSSRRSQSTSGFYAAEGSISGPMNGFAIAGDFLSATTFLGISGLVFMVGFDAAIFVMAPLAGLVIILTLVAERVRNLGQYTLADVLEARFPSPLVRGFAAIVTLFISLLYLMGQMVGAGALIQILFDIPYPIAVTIIGGLMVMYVGVGGMVATTWVQIVKAMILLVGLSYLSYGVLDAYGFDLKQLYGDAVVSHPEANGLFEANGLLLDTFSSVSLAAALVFGMVGLPHILIRFFTVPDARAARQSVVVALAIISVVFLLIFFIIGYGGIGLLKDQKVFFGPDGGLIGGSNMMVIHLSGLVGGEAFRGAISAVAFATILAVVSGLVVASTGAIAHDLYARIWRRGQANEEQEMKVSRIATVTVGAAAIILSLAFEGQNLAYLVSLAFTVAASTNFPALMLVLYWRGLTREGLVAGGFAGLLAAIAALIFGPAVWVDILGYSEALFPYRYPVFFTMTVAFAIMVLVSLVTAKQQGSESQNAFDRQYKKGLFG